MTNRFFPKSTWIVPTDPAVAAQVLALSEAHREFFEERAAIIEFDGGIQRIEAEKEALTQTKEYFS